MLGDLKDKLAPLGRLDVLQAIGDQALLHYAGDDLHRLDAAALGRRARALRLIAEMARQRLDDRQALIGFEQAAATTAALLDQAPDSIERLQEHSASLDRLYELADGRGAFAAALDTRRDIAGLARRLAALQPGNAQVHIEAIKSVRELAYMLNRANRSDEALALLGQADASASGLQAPPDKLREVLEEGALSGRPGACHAGATAPGDRCF